MKNYGIDGGSFYHWTSFNLWEDFDPAIQPPIKHRGTEFIYLPAKDSLEKLYTQGQVHTLDLVPDAIPPVFVSASTSPIVVKNGDTLKISAALGETHLFVTADLSDLDTSKAIPVVLLDQGDGTYSRDVTLNLWNEGENGMKSLEMSAMDFWSNVASTAVGIELSNPPPVLDSAPPDDNFAGTVLDAAKWVTESAGGGIIAQMAG